MTLFLLGEQQQSKEKTTFTISHYRICPSTQIDLYHTTVTTLTVNVPIKGQIHPLLPTLEHASAILSPASSIFPFLLDLSYRPTNMLKHVSLILKKIKNPFYLTSPSIYWPISLLSIYNKTPRTFVYKCCLEFLLFHSQTPIRFHPHYSTPN